MEATNGPVLAATDLSSDSRKALVWAARYADAFRVPLIIIHVVHDPLDDPGFYRKNENDPMMPMEEIAKSMLDDFVAETIKDHPDCTVLKSAQQLLVKGTPTRRIIETAEATGAQLIAMGSIGRSAVQDLFLGSTTKAVIKSTTIPVISTRVG